jgi:hypothetical protein
LQQFFSPLHWLPTSQIEKGNPVFPKVVTQKTTATTIKTITVVNRKNQEKTISHLRRLGISQIRHPKPGSLIPCPPEQISQIRRLHHFPNSTPGISRIRHLTFPVFLVTWRNEPQNHTLKKLSAYSFNLFTYNCFFRSTNKDLPWLQHM